MNVTMTSYPPGWMTPEWPTPPWVRAVMTARAGGVSRAPHDSFNLGDHVGDSPLAVATNRAALGHMLDAQPVYLRQVHGVACVGLYGTTPDGVEADACHTGQPGVACTVMVADCLPVLIAHRHQPCVAAVHAGWRGLAGQNSDGGVLTQIFKEISASPHVKYKKYAIKNIATKGNSAATVTASDWLVWLGPCIGPRAFEVGTDVRETFLHSLPGQALAVQACFRRLPGVLEKYHCDLPALARLRLRNLGVTAVYGNDGSDEWCTVSQPQRWYSHRRDASRLGSTGRMAACIWLV